MLMDDWLLYVTCLVLVSHRPITCSEPNVSKEYCKWDAFETRCLPDEIVVMESARYGRMSIGRCVKQAMGELGCSTDVIHYMDHVCTGRQQCKIIVPNPDIDKFNPCLKEVTSYLEASYSCRKVISGDASECRLMKPFHVKEQRGFISNHVTLLTGCGSSSSPWLLEAKVGQRINISLWNIDRMRSYKPDSCQRIFSVVENRHQPPDNLISGSSSGSLKNRKQNTANKHNFNVRNKEPLIVCSDPQVRIQHVFLSASHSVSLSIIHQPPSTHTSAGPTHLVEFNVLGCADYKTNDANMWTKRINDVTAIGCHSDDELTRWKLNCVLDQWLGDVGRCEESGTSDVLSSRGGEQLKITSVLSFIIVVCISFIIGLCVLIVGLVWMHRKRKLMRSNSSPETSYFNKMECFKAHEGNKTVVLNSSDNNSDNNTDFELYSKTSSACKRHQNINIKVHQQNKRSQPQQQQQPQQHRQQQQMIRSRSPNYPVNSSAVLIHGYHVGSVDLINSAITSTCAVHHQPTCSTTTADITSHNTFQESSNSGPLAVFYSPYCPRHYFTTAGGAENEIEENVNNCVNQQSSIDQQILQHKDSSLYACIKDGAISTFQTVLPENGNVEASNQLAPGGTKIKFVSTNPPNGNQMEFWNKTNFFEKIDDKNSNRAFTSIKCDSPVFKPRQSGNESDNGKRRFSVSCYQEEQNFSDC